MRDVYLFDNTGRICKKTQVGRDTKAVIYAGRVFIIGYGYVNHSRFFEAQHEKA